MLLENDPENGCVGCGPQNPVGLRLKFERNGESVASAFVAEARFEGWPGRLHSAILYLAMLETANWTVFGLLERVGLPTRTGALAARRLVVTGETLRLEGRFDGPARVVVEARDASGAVVATLEREYDLPARSEFLRRMGYDHLPPGLEGLLPE